MEITRNTKRSLAVTIASLFLVREQTLAGLVHAADPSGAKIAAAIAAASDDDTVVVPTGTAAWTSAITVSKPITLQGQGVGKTIILDSLPSTAPHPQSLLVFNTSANANVRLTGIEFRFDPTSRKNNFGQGLVQLKGSSNAVRVDHCKFVGIKNRCLYLSGSVFGVMDHCEVHNDAAIQGPIYILHDGIPGPHGESGSSGDGSWAIPSNLGSANAFFLEDDMFTTSNGSNLALTDGNAGCRFVVRYCTIHNHNIQAHGTGSTGRTRSVRTSEIYMNTFDYGHGVSTNALFMRGGTGVCWGNAVIGDAGYGNALFTFHNYRSNEYIWPVLTNNRGDGSDGASGFDLNDTSDHTGNGYNGGPGGVWASGTAQAGSSGRILVISGSGMQNWKGYAVVNLDQTYTIRGNTYNTFATIQGNKGNTFTVGIAPHPYAVQSWSVGHRYVIRKCNFSMDTIGAGQGDYLGGSNNTPPKWSHQDWSRRSSRRSRGTFPSPRWLHQASEPYYLWDNTYNGSHSGFAQGSGGGEINTTQTNFVDNGTTPMPGYTPYVYPHPLISGNRLPSVTPSPPAATRISVRKPWGKREKTTKHINRKLGKKAKENRTNERTEGQDNIGD